jgi:hypothetical protein
VERVTIDSWNRVADRQAEDPELLASLQDAAWALRQKSSSLTIDLDRARAVYEYPLFGDEGLVSHLIDHRRPFPIPPILGAIPTARFTGLVIYAAEAIPAHGLNEDRLPKPCLFPRIFDQEMELVLDSTMCDPAFLLRWGMIEYSSDLDLRRFSDRIGVNPMTVMARGVFGRNDTDLIIATEAARRLRASPEGRQALREGRILVIYRGVHTDLLEELP